MGELDWQARAAPDVQRLVDGLLEVVAPVADVARVAAPVPRRDLRQGYQLRLRGVLAGRILQARREAYGARGHGLVHEGPHRFQLGSRRRARVESHSGQPYRTVCDQRGDVHRLALLEQGLQVLRKGIPGKVYAPVLVVPDSHHLGELPVRRRRGPVAAVPDHQRRQPLPYPALGQAVHVDWKVGVAVHVDETRRHGLPRRVNLPRGLHSPHVAYELHAPCVHGDIAHERRGAGAVEHR